MFTGIVEATGEVVEAADEEGGRRLRIVVPFADELNSGASISVSGACLTVERRGEDWFEVFLAAETVDRTYLGDLRPGDGVNLERAMAADGRFDGHVVQGHVDATTTVTDVRPLGEDWEYSFALGDWERYVVEKGSITIDGISLTVADLDEATLTTAIIPETRERTTLSEKEPGDPVHVEVDVIGKYVERLLD